MNPNPCLATVVTVILVALVVPVMGAVEAESHCSYNARPTEK